MKNFGTGSLLKKNENLMHFWCENEAVERVFLWFSLEASSETLALSGSENLMILGFQNHFQNHENIVIWPSSGSFLALRR